MSSVFDGIDMSDPCSVWPVLDEVLNRLLAGEMAVRGRFGNDEHQFQQSDIDGLKSRIRTLKAECTAKQTGKPRRRAFTFG